MSAPDHLAALVEAEEFSGGSMTVPTPSTFNRDGYVVVEAKGNGTWQADCGRCGAGCGAAGFAGPDDELNTDELDDEHRMLTDFTAEHRDCSQPLDDTAVELPSPGSMVREIAPRPAVWIVRGTNGSDIRVLAERHTTYARPDGTELRFYDGSGDEQHRVATVRAGSWHWVVAETALNPESGEQ
ncbi:hypothetical protein [Dietzia alimentaria]|uniref:hypothetical protein n=1 Tax=Dietzia alimentaria TaxID=665550 RepID=UPI00029A0482|nr:hypothetical protein [Dietzia alimentaria]